MTRFTQEPKCIPKLEKFRLSFVCSLVYNVINIFDGTVPEKISIRAIAI